MTRRASAEMFANRTKLSVVCTNGLIQVGAGHRIPIGMQSTRGMGKGGHRGGGVEHGTWMRVHGKRVLWRIRGLAIITIVVGVALAGMGSGAAAQRSPGKFAVIKFFPSLHQVTLTIPTPPCKQGPPGCVWRLWVNEPFAPGAPVLGTVTGTSGVLTVTYPATVCGTVQGDASVTLQADVSEGGPTVRHKFGHRLTITCPPNSANSRPPTTTPDPTTQLPFTGAVSGSPTDPASTSRVATTTAAVSQLPFTGVDVRPLAVIGIALILLGLMLVTRPERQRRVVHWFFGL
jgi:hypothetical protein